MVGTDLIIIWNPTYSPSITFPRPQKSHQTRQSNMFLRLRRVMFIRYRLCAHAAVR